MKVICINDPWNKVHYFKQFKVPIFGEPYTVIRTDKGLEDISRRPMTCYWFSECEQNIGFETSCFIPAENEPDEVEVKELEDVLS